MLTKDELLDTLFPNRGGDDDDGGDEGDMVNPFDMSEDEEEEGEESGEELLEKFTTDITNICKEKGYGKVIGREKEISRMIEVLSRKTKNNPVLVGDPGVGKTSIVTALAQAIVAQKVPVALFSKRILSVDVAGLVAGTIYRGQFESRLRGLIKAAKDDKSIILFIDELHTIIGAGNPSGQLDAASILKAPLSNGEIQIIGATTTKEYTHNIEKDSALARRFQKIDVAEPDDEEAIGILKGIKKQYETFHGVIYDDEAIYSIVKMSRRYLTEQFLPDKAIDLMDEAGARVKISAKDSGALSKKLTAQINLLLEQKKEAVEKQSFESAAMLRDKIATLKTRLQNIELKNKGKLKIVYQVTQNDVARVVSSLTGIPLDKLSTTEEERLLHMEAAIHESIVAQDEAVSAVCNAVRRSKAGISSDKRPLASFIFLGPTGVGKTQLAKVLAKWIFGREDALLRIDMSDYSEETSISRLVGTSPGYVGYEEGGVLTDYVRRHPYSIVLLDEIEKANPKIFNILLQMLEEGELADKLGHKVNFRNTIIIMTSNAGSRQITQEGKVGFGISGNYVMSASEIKANATNELKKLMNPEIINRIDEIITFEPLTQEQVALILDMQLKELGEVLHERGLALDVKKNAKSYLVKKGFNPTMGARPMRRLIQKELESPLSLLMLDKHFKNCDTVTVDASAIDSDDAKLVVKLTKTLKKDLTKELTCTTM